MARYQASKKESGSKFFLNASMSNLESILFSARGNCHLCVSLSPMDPKENGLKFYKNHLYSNVDVVSNILKLTFSFENCPSKLIFYE